MIVVMFEFIDLTSPVKVYNTLKYKIVEKPQKKELNELRIFAAAVHKMKGEMLIVCWFNYYDGTLL